ncbi:MAG: 30S ribosomal protein S3 [Proteobacteria bacterium]|nr:30S ribosomal protein S3 [Pseudomonadota bacterium]MBU4278100.1 30S ribosomal protein S3 [Pseudomonadota bacterium]MBU4381492.1 30S ribosomal protein S3 [Pseudomonadota bacterium]MBU4603595.1 30S ribosomal protein S3 [Pseudomonadota bacterium]MCG2764973.1 30S ribosomal protein S3 [Desulfarculaceae bacterium]
MGQKVHPVGFRLGIIRTWDSRWFANKDYAALVYEDWQIRTFVKKKLAHAGVSRIEIERAADKAKIRIHTARPGIVIGKKGSEIESLKRELEKLVKRDVMVDIHEVRKPEIDAQLVAENVAGQLLRRIAFRRAMKRAVMSAMKFGAQGIRIQCAGRLGGAEMARREWYREGRVPLHTLRADIDVGFTQAQTTYGIIGVQVLVFKGEVLDDSDREINA